MDSSDAPPHCTYTFGRQIVSIHDMANCDTMVVAKWRGPLQICQASTLFGVSSMFFRMDSECMHQMRDVPTWQAMASPPCFALISMKLSMTVCMASSQLMRCHPGSSPLGFVRFMG